MTTPAATPDLSAFVFNKEPRCACVLLLDTSASMDGAPIAALNAGLQSFRQALSADANASKRVEPCVIVFGDEAKVLAEFTTADRWEPPTLAACGATPMAEAIDLALDALERRQASYREARVPTYRPWVFLITDGAPTSPPERMEAVRARLRPLVAAKKIAFFGVGVTDEALPFLESLGSVPKRLAGLAFQELFLWLSGSLRRVSGSQPGDRVQHGPTDPWSEG